MQTQKPISPLSAEILTHLIPRTREWHKGLSGAVCVVGGDVGLSGAVQMAASAALRVGAGLVTVATHPYHAALINITYPEIISHGVDHEHALELLLDRATVIILGPGLGQSDWSRWVWEKTISYNQPMIVDADGLNLLALNPKQKSSWILTPHPGEAARLLHIQTEEVQADRIRAAQSIQAQYGGVCVLKGAGSLIAIGDETFRCDLGNPGMATAGMGDVLTGVIAGLAAQKISLPIAAGLGVYIHAKAGDEAAIHGERGMLATDLLPYLRLLVNQPIIK